MTNELTLEIMEAGTQNFDQLVDICEHKLKAILDNHAPMKERSLTIRHTVPWFTTKIITQKRKVQRREKNTFLLNVTLQCSTYRD